MSAYKERSIRFCDLVEVNDWKVKIYTISKEGDFNNESFIRNVIKKLPDWLELKNGFDDSNDKIAFLILHSGTEGIFSLINWWVGTNMLNTHIFFSNHDDQENFKMISGTGLAPCIWELEVINHERVSWTKNILKASENPNLEKYLSDVINMDI